MDASTMTPLEAAEIIERGDCGQCRYDAENTAIRLLRAIAAGEYKRVVHGRWKEAIDEGPYGDWVACSNCGYETNREPLYCPSCGALMGGKDDSR